MFGLSVATAPRPTRSKVRGCAECDNAAAPGSVFCSRGCQRSFNNRRAVRGAELYDLFMALRYERPLAKALGLWRLICRMAMHFRDEDLELRDGRKSWHSPRKVIARRTYLHATTVGRNIAGRRR